MLFHRLRRRRPPVIAERFVSPVAGLSRVVLPLDVVARRPAARLRFLLFVDGGAPDYRVATLANPSLLPEESLRLEFAPFEAPAGTAFLLGVIDLSAATGEIPVAADLRAVRAAAAGRPPIALDCRGVGEETDPLTDERGIAAFRGDRRDTGRRRSPGGPRRRGRPAADRPRLPGSWGRDG